jgi:pimeloyl-ACP methyl ester carboxylesterase
MPSTITIPDPPTPAQDSPSAPAVERTPFYLESLHQGIFAWLHRCASVPPANHGVVICPPIGHEQIHSHRSLRHLADACARAGFPTLRLDYHGTGDSEGSDEDPARCATWLANIRDAQVWMREQLGCERITLVGLRLGAALAAEAATTLAIDGLLLWAPVVKGRTYVREMKALSLTEGGGGGLAPGAAGADIEAAGFVLTEQTALDIGLLDLLKCHPHCRRALILDRDDMPQDTRSPEHLKTLGITTEQNITPGYADMMAEPHHTRVPHKAIATAVEWLRAGELQGDKETRRGGDKEKEAPSAAVSLAHSPHPFRERIVRIGSQGELFGIISESSVPSSQSLPFVVLLNAGSAYRVGPSRLHVSLARQLAAVGFRCLRLDLGGLGDSNASDPARENDPYPATAFRDIDTTLKYLRSEFGADRVVLMGLCSGAYFAFQSAAQLGDPALVESVAINPLTFWWKDGMSLDISPGRRIEAFHDVVSALFKPGKWLKLLSGRSKNGIKAVMQIVAGWWQMRSRKTARPVADTSTDVLSSHPQEEDLPGDLVRIAQTGRHLAFFFSRADPGYGLLQFHAQRKARALCRAGKMSVHFIEDADHTFSRRDWRRALGEAIREHLVRRYAQRGQP